MNEQLRLARAAFDDAQMAYDNEPDTDSAVDKLMDAVANLLNWAEAKENQPPEIVDIPPPPAEPVCEQPEAIEAMREHAAAFDLAEAVRQQQRQMRVQQGDIGAAHWETLTSPPEIFHQTCAGDAHNFDALRPIRTRVRPNGLVEAILPPPPSIADLSAF